MKINRYFRGKILVVIDAANLESSVKSLKFWIDYLKLKRLFDDKRLVEIRDYCVQHNTKNQNKFFTFLKKSGYKLVTKPIKIIKAPEIKTGDIRKANFDVEITVDVLDMIKKFNTLVLFSGDSDFDYLIRYLRAKGKRVIVISTKHHISKELIESSNKYIEIKKIKELIERKKNKSPSFSTGD
jgi:uncharacterized LabA/DUF88 family protein